MTSANMNLAQYDPIPVLADNSTSAGQQASVPRSDAAEEPGQTDVQENLESTMDEMRTQLASAQAENAALREALDERRATQSTVVMIVANNYRDHGNFQGVQLHHVTEEATKHKEIAEKYGAVAILLQNTTLAELRAKLDMHRPTVLIFCGHGDADIGDGKALAFMNTQSNRMELVSDTEVAELLHLHAARADDRALMSGGVLVDAQLRFIILNACCTYRFAEQLRQRVPPALEHIFCWQTVTLDAAACIFGYILLDELLGNAHDQGIRAAYDRAHAYVLSLRVPSTLSLPHEQVVPTEVPRFAFISRSDTSRVDYNTGRLYDSRARLTDTLAAGVPAFVDLRLREREAKKREFVGGLVPLLRDWIQDAPSKKEPLTRLSGALDRLEMRAAEGNIDAQTECTRLARLVVAFLREEAISLFINNIDQMRRLLRVVLQGNAIFSNVYSGMLDMVRENDGYVEFCSKLGDIKIHSSQSAQPVGNLMDIYAAAARAMPHFEVVLAELVKRSASCKPHMRIAPLKHIFRVLQKHALRTDGIEPADCSTACDIVRGSIACDSMNGLLRVLHELLGMQEEGTIRVVRVKNRFSAPTAMHWADAVVYLVCVTNSVGSSGNCGNEMSCSHVCELQLIHTHMLKARKEFGGHNAYTVFREAAEMLDYVFTDYIRLKNDPAKLVEHMSSMDKSNGIVLRTAANVGQVQVVKAFMATAGEAQKHSRDVGKALMRAAYNGHASIVNIVSKASCLEMREASESLVLAALQGHTRIVAILIEIPCVDVNYVVVRGSRLDGVDGSQQNYEQGFANGNGLVPVFCSGDKSYFRFNFIRDSALRQAVLQRNKDMVKLLLAAPGLDITAGISVPWRIVQNCCSPACSLVCDECCSVCSFACDKCCDRCCSGVAEHCFVSYPEVREKYGLCSEYSFASYPEVREEFGLGSGSYGLRVIFWHRFLFLFTGLAFTGLLLLVIYLEATGGTAGGSKDDAKKKEVFAFLLLLGGSVPILLLMVYSMQSMFEFGEYHDRLRVMLSAPTVFSAHRVQIVLPGRTNIDEASDLGSTGMNSCWECRRCCHLWACFFAHCMSKTWVRTPCIIFATVGTAVAFMLVMIVGSSPYDVPISLIVIGVSVFFVCSCYVAWARWHCDQLYRNVLCRGQRALVTHARAPTRNMIARADMS